MEELAAFATQVTTGKGELLMNRRRPEVIDLDMARHCQQAKRTIELGHSLIEQRGNQAAVDVAGRALVDLRKLDGSGDGASERVEGEVKVQALRVAGPAAEALPGELVDGFFIHGFRIGGCGMSHVSSDRCRF